MKKLLGASIVLYLFITPTLLYAWVPYQGAKCDEQTQTCMTKFYECCNTPLKSPSTFWVQTPVDPLSKAAIEFACMANHFAPNIEGPETCGLSTPVLLSRGNLGSHIPANYKIVSFSNP